MNIQMYSTLTEFVMRKQYKYYHTGIVAKTMMIYSDKESHNIKPSKHEVIKIILKLMN